MAFVVAAFSGTLRREAAAGLLQGAGHTCVFFDTGAAAVAEALAGTPDVLVVDIELDDMTVAEICDAMWSRPGTADIPVVTCDLSLNRSIVSAVASAVAGPAGRTDRVLLVEDDDAIAVPVIDGLARYGILADRVATGREALAAPPAAMVLLDLGLPDIDGLEVCRQLRRTGDMPIIMLTARGDETDRVVGLELGADDYLAKPFSIRELVARIRAVGRRGHLRALAGQAG
jgi:DNA-binding response OmpR family regulator